MVAMPADLGYFCSLHGSDSGEPLWKIENFSGKSEALFISGELAVITPEQHSDTPGNFTHWRTSIRHIENDWSRVSDLTMVPRGRVIVACVRDYLPGPAMARTVKQR